MESNIKSGAVEASSPMPKVSEEQVRQAILNGSQRAIEAVRGACRELPEGVRAKAAEYAISWAVDTVRFENSIMHGHENRSR